MTRDQERGRIVLLVHFALLLMLSLSAIGSYVFFRGTGKLPSQAFRTVLEIALLVWIYRGSNIARVIAIILLGLSGGGALIAFAFVDGNVFGIIMMGAMATVFLSFAGVLLVSPNVAAFLEYQRNRFAASAELSATDD